MDLPRAWTAFGGASLALMGTALAAGARRLAADNLAWRREWCRAVGAPEAGLGDGRVLRLACRVGGTLGALAGLGVAAAAAAGRALSPARFGSGDPRALGACFALLGAAFTAMKASRGAARVPRFLGEGEDPEPQPLGERIAGASTWLLCALWIAFGLRLLTENLR
jgi:hypothetical protein